MSTLVNSPADELVQSEASVDVTARASSIDMFIGSRVRIKRTSRGMTQHELSELLNIDYDNLAAYEAGVERINARLLFRLPNRWTCGRTTFFAVTPQEIGRRPKIQT
jgi:transcriptional regulator with XRE-family HTH domain